MDVPLHLLEKTDSQTSLDQDLVQKVAARLLPDFLRLSKEQTTRGQSCFAFARFEKGNQTNFTLVLKNIDVFPIVALELPQIIQENQVFLKMVAQAKEEKLKRGEMLLAICEDDPMFPGCTKPYLWSRIRFPIHQIIVLKSRVNAKSFFDLVHPQERKKGLWEFDFVKRMHTELKHTIAPICSFLLSKGFCRISTVCSNNGVQWVPFGCDKIECLMENEQQVLLSWELCFRLLEKANKKEEANTKKSETKKQWKIQRVSFENEFAKEQILHYLVFPRFFMTKQDNQIVFFYP